MASTPNSAKQKITPKIDKQNFPLWKRMLGLTPTNANVPPHTWAESPDLSGKQPVYSEFTGEQVGYLKDNTFHQTADRIPQPEDGIATPKEPQSAKDWKGLVDHLSAEVAQTTGEMRGYERGSKQYKTMLANLNLSKTQLDVAQKKYKAVSDVEAKQNAAVQTKKQQTDAINQSKDKLAKVSNDLLSLQDERQRLIDTGGSTTAIDIKIDNLKKQASTLKSSISSPVSTTPTTTTATPNQPQGTLGANAGTTIPTSGTVTPPVVTKPIAKKTTATGAKGTDKKAPPPPILTQQDFLTKYGTTLAFIQSDPSLTKLFNDARAGNWQNPKFQAMLQQTDWARKFSAQAQQQELARTQSPSTYGQSWNNMRNLIATTAVSLGLNIRPQDVGNELKPSGTGGVWKATDVPRQDGTITQWALEHANDQNFQQELQQHLTTVGNINLNMPGGTAGSDIQALKQYAGQMGLLGYTLPSATDPNNPNVKGMDYFSSAAQSILLGKSDLETWKADLLNQAKGRYKAFASSLDAGQTVQNLAAPYINTLANLLEISPDKVDLSSPTGYGKMVNDALMGTDATNQTPTTLTDFEKQVKARPEWGFTNNARDTLMPGVDTLLKTLGKVS